MASKLGLTVGGRPQFLSHGGFSVGCLSVPTTWQLALLRMSESGERCRKKQFFLWSNLRSHIASFCVRILTIVWLIFKGREIRCYILNLRRKKHDTQFEVFCFIFAKKPLCLNRNGHLLFLLLWCASTRYLNKSQRKRYCFFNAVLTMASDGLWISAILNWFLLPIRYLSLAVIQFACAFLFLEHISPGLLPSLPWPESRSDSPL